MGENHGRPPTGPYAREKLRNACLFLRREVHGMERRTLFLLLWMMDFELFAQTGRAVFGLRYAADAEGPVPEVAESELRVQGEFELDFFTPRELAVLQRLATEFADADAALVRAVLERPTSAWRRVWLEEGRRGSFIPYRYALDAPGSLSAEQVDLVEEEHMALERFFGEVSRG